MRRILIVFLAIVLPLIIFPSVSFASTLSLSPGSASVSVGKIRNFIVQLNTQSDSVNAVSAVINYPQDLVEIAYVTPSAVLSIPAEKTFGNGVIKISRGSISPVFGTVTVATIGVKGKSPGSATLYFTNGSAAPKAVDSTDSLNLSQSMGTVIKVRESTATTMTNSAASVPVVGVFENTILFSLAGIFLTSLGILGFRFTH